jgi:hypothetical protein
VYVTVLVTTSLMWRTLVLVDFCFFCSAKWRLSADSQSNDEWTQRALKGDLGMLGESRLDRAGLGGSFMLGKEAGPVGGADIGADVGNGLGGTKGAVAGGDSLLGAEVGGDRSHLHEQSECSLLEAVPGRESGVDSPEEAAVGEPRAIALVRKSVYAEGGLMGVLM